MANAIEMFRKQREAVEQVHSRLLEVSRLLNQLQAQASALATDKELRATLGEEQRWLAEARGLVAEVRRLRQSEDYRWAAKLRRWVLTCLFAVASAMAAGAGYGVVTRGDAENPESLRSRAAFADAILERLDIMTPTERRQFDRLLKGSTPIR